MTVNYLTHPVAVSHVTEVEEEKKKKLGTFRIPGPGERLESFVWPWTLCGSTKQAKASCVAHTCYAGAVRFTEYLCYTCVSAYT